MAKRDRKKWNTDREMTLSEIGKALGITKQAVRDAEQRALNKLYRSWRMRQFVAPSILKEK